MPREELGDESSDHTGVFDRRDYAVIGTGLVVHLATVGIGGTPVEGFLAAAFAMMAVATVIIGGMYRD